MRLNVASFLQQPLNDGGGEERFQDGTRTKKGGKNRFSFNSFAWVFVSRPMDDGFSQQQGTKIANKGNGNSLQSYEREKSFLAILADTKRYIGSIGLPVFVIVICKRFHEQLLMSNCESPLKILSRSPNFTVSVSR